MPDPVPFDKKLKSMLEDHADFIRTKEEEMVGNAVLEEVRPSMLCRGLSTAHGCDEPFELSNTQRATCNLQAKIYRSAGS